MTRPTGKEKTTRRQHAPEFRAEALALADRVGVPTAAVELALHESQIYGWRSKARAKADRSQVDQDQAAEPPVDPAAAPS